MGSLVAAYTVAWVILMVYVLTLGARQRRLQKTLKALETESPAPGSETASGAHGR